MKRGVAAGILVATFVLASAQRSAGSNGGTERPLQQLDIATTISEQQIVREARPQRDQLEHSGKLGTMQGRAAQGSSLLKELQTSIRQPSTSLDSFSALTEMLDQHHHKMSTQQLEELRAMLRRLRGSKQRQASEELRTSFRQTGVSLRREADQVLGRRQAYATSQAYDPVAGAFDKDVLKDRTYSVILYHEPPFVMIKDPPPDPKAKPGVVVDPGNLNQTRTPSNGLLSGFTIDVLESLAVDLGVTLKYYYPCKKKLYADTGSCGSAGQDEALDWLKKGDTSPVMRATYFGDVTEMCGDQILLAESQFRCFVAGGVRISAEYYQDFFMTQSMWDTGYALVTLSKTSPTKLMAFAFPFWFETWIVIIAELVIVGMCFVYAEGYGTNQCMYTPLDLSTCKGYQVYVWSVLSALWRWSDGLYWAGTICLGAADKAPTTIAGRLLVTVQLFFALIVMTMYTGGVATFLSETSSGSKVTSFNDYIDQTSGSFDPENTLCITDSTSVKDFLALQAKILQKNTALKNFKTVRGTSIQDCYSKVYKEEAVAAVYDHAVALYELSEMKRSGKCGDNGGMCILNQDRPPAANVGSAIAGVEDKKSCDAIGQTWIPGTGTMIIAGNIMNPFGYGLAFKKVGHNMTFAPTSDYIAFSQGLQLMRDNFKLKALQDQYFSDPDGLPCSADSNDAVQLTFQNVSGLFVICVIVMALGGIVGLVSFVQVTLIKLLPCCPSPKEEEEEIHDDDEGEIDEEEKEKRAEINRRVIVIQKRLLKVEETFGVSSASEENGDCHAPVDQDGIVISTLNPSNMFASIGWVFEKPKV